MLTFIFFGCFFALILSRAHCIIPDALNDAWSAVKESVQEMFNCIKINRPPAISDVHFFLYTPTNKNDPEEIIDLQLNKCKHFNATHLTKVIIHGYTQSHKTELFIRMKDAYVSTGVLNVIMVNWEKLAAPPCYPEAADYTSFVGQLTGYLLKQIPSDKLHVIGFSLGAHVAGISSDLQENKYQRITGLDPAMPLFFNISKSRRLDSEDAKNVDVIHTSYLGYLTTLGHADFFVNGGRLQPGCAPTDVTCSHRRSVELYAESITSNVGLKATLCDSLKSFESNNCANHTFTPMGEPWLARGAMRGTFFLKSNDLKPFAIEES